MFCTDIGWRSQNPTADQQKKKKSSYFTVRRFSQSHISQYSSWVRIFKNSKNIKACLRYMISAQNKNCLFPLFKGRESGMWLWVSPVMCMYSTIGRSMFADPWGRAWARVHTSQDRLGCLITHSGTHMLIRQDKGRNTSSHTCNSYLSSAYKTDLEPEQNSLAVRKEWYFSCRKYHPSCRSHFSCYSSIPRACWHFMPTWSHSIFQE